MCLAPRYINGAIAGPLIDWTKAASRPVTPCASATSANRGNPTAAKTSASKHRCRTLPPSTANQWHDPDLYGQRVVFPIPVGIDNDTLPNLQRRRVHLLLVLRDLRLLVDSDRDGLPCVLFDR